MCAPTQRLERKRLPTPPPGPACQAQSGNSAPTEMTQSMSGSGARRWSVRKHCRAGRISENPRWVVPVSGGPGESGLRDAGGTDVEPWSRRERHPASLWSLSGRSESDPPRRAESIWEHPAAKVGRAKPAPTQGAGSAGGPAGAQYAPLRKGGRHVVGAAPRAARKDFSRGEGVQRMTLPVQSLPPSGGRCHGECRDG